jgi:hypothetical protein
VSYWDEAKKREWLKRMKTMTPEQQQGLQREMDIRDLEERLGVVAENLRNLPEEKAERVIAQIKQEQEHFEKLTAEQEGRERIADYYDPDRAFEWEKQRDFVLGSQRRYISRAQEEHEKESREGNAKASPDDKLRQALKAKAQQRQGQENDRDRERER